METGSLAGSAIDIAPHSKSEALAVLNTVPVRGKRKGDAEQVLKSYGVETAPVTPGHRIAFVHSLIADQGVLEYEPNGKAAEEIAALFRAIYYALPMEFSCRKEGVTMKKSSLADVLLKEAKPDAYPAACFKLWLFSIRQDVVQAGVHAVCRTIQR